MRIYDGDVTKVRVLSADQEARALDLTERYDVQLWVARKWVTGEMRPPPWVNLIADERKTQ